VRPAFEPFVAAEIKNSSKSPALALEGADTGTGRVENWPMFA